MAADLYRAVDEQLQRINVAVSIQAGVEAGTHSANTYPAIRAIREVASALWELYQLHHDHLLKRKVAMQQKESA